VIVTDSASDIDPALITELGIEIVPLKVSLGAETFLDGITIRSAEFFERLRSSDVFP
ncbi:MAG TPA: DegV family protein, partial [Brevibacillus sp.]|nr:DegV family protein [Brevibacillus sp.]